MTAEETVRASSDAESQVRDVCLEKEGGYLIDPLAHYLHQDNAVWRAIGWVIPIEAGMLAGAFAKPGLPGFLVVLLGSVFVVAFWMYAWKSAKDRDVNLDIIDKYKPDGFRLTCEVAWWGKGSFWLIVEFCIIVLVNSGLLVVEFCKWHEYWTDVTAMFFN